MEATILNIYDLALLVSIFLSLLLAAMLSSEPTRPARRTLQLFLLLLAAEAAYTVVFYSVLGKTYIANGFPLLYFFLVAAFFVKGQVLYFYVKGHCNPKKKTILERIVHLGPLIIYLVSVLSIYQQGGGTYDTFIRWQSRLSYPSLYHIIQIGYAGAALFLAYKNYEGNLLASANKSAVSVQKHSLNKNMFIIVIFCLCLWATNFVSHLAYYLTLNIDIASIIGKIVIAGNLLLIVTLFHLFWQQRHATESNVTVTNMDELISERNKGMSEQDDSDIAGC